jgi:DNA polymerase-3 subunit delta'
MNDQAANTLLKTLEEPSGNTMFILTTSQRESLPQTILSRCQQVRFDPLTETDLQDALVVRKGIPVHEAALVARLAHGSYTHAIELLDTDLTQEREEVITFLLNVVLDRYDAVVDTVEDLSRGKDREHVTRFLQLMLLWFRDALTLSHGGAVINIDLEERLSRFVARYAASNLQQILADIEKAISLVERFVYIKLVLLQLAVELKANIREAP